MLTSDHGGPFGEHGVIRKSLLTGYEELAHIPWIVKLPGNEQAGPRTAAFVQPPDMLPTVMDLTGISFDSLLNSPWGPSDLADMPGLSGKSLVPLLRGDTETLWGFAVTAHHRNSWTIRTQDWTCIHYLNERPTALYDRNSDPAELTDIAAQHPDAVAVWCQYGQVRHNSHHI